MSDRPSSLPSATRCGFVALIGAPNTGKSTLLNQLVGQKLAIVTHKVQTTRMRLRGIAIKGKTQIVFVDTPGIFAPRRRLDRAMVSAAWEGAEDADIRLLVIDATRGLKQEDRQILDKIAAAGRKALVALNKIDRIERRKLLPLAAEIEATGIAQSVFMISALTGDGVDELKSHVAARLPEGPWLYPEDQVSDVTSRMMAAEITREKIYLRLHQELPYAIAVETETWCERADGSVEIRQVIHVARDSQKGIVIGKGGRTLKTIGEEARHELEELLERRVHLFLFVRVSERWTEDRALYHALGLDYVD